MSSRPTTMATHGMIATPHYLATSAGLQVLEDGGSAMDAVICANAVLTVLYPDQTAIGGDCFFLAYDAATGSTQGFNGSGPAPALADPEQLRRAGYNAMPGKGPFAVTIPGTIDAWFQAHERYGKLEMARLLAPAITLARDGFPVSERFGAALAANGELINAWGGLRALVYPNGTAPTPGSTLRFPALATSLETIARDGRDAFYRGPIAEAIAATMRELGGWLTMDDLDAYAGEWVSPITSTYRGVTIATLPPNSQGIAALMGLRMVENEDLGSRWGAAEHVHPMVEAARRAYNERNARITDPRFADIDTDALLSDDHITALWADYNPTRSSQTAPHTAGDTVYLCAVDADGNAVSQIQSLFGAFGSAVVAGNTGILLQNRGSFFSLNPDHVNVLAPGKRTLHTLIASMLFDGDTLRGPIGAQGGDAQALINMQLMSNVIDFGMAPQAAIEAPRWLLPNAGTNGVVMELGFPDGTVQQMSARGHVPTLIDRWSSGAGHAQMIMRDPDSGVLLGGADPRADGAAAGF